MYCKKCGICFKGLKLSPLYFELDRGDGICKNFDSVNNLCNIYKGRPILCNIDKTFKKYFSKNMTKDEYYKLNYQYCNKLKLQ